MTALDEIQRKALFDCTTHVRESCVDRKAKIKNDGKTLNFTIVCNRIIQ